MIDIEFEESANPGKSVSEALGAWFEMHSETSPPKPGDGELLRECVAHDIVFVELGTHQRGRFVHSHKGKAKRQHVLKDYYTKSTHLLKNCHPISSGPFSDVLPYTITYAEHTQS